MNRLGPFQKAQATDAIAGGRKAEGPSTDGVNRIGNTRRRDVDRTEKRAFVQALQAVFADTSFVLVSHNKGLTVAEATALRQRMRDAGATYKVAKNRLAALALDGSNFTGIQPLLKGPTALAWSKDPVAVAKTAVEFARTNDRFVILGGALGTQTLNADGVKALAELPSLETLRAQLLGLIQTPATRIAGVLQAPGSQLARVFSAYAKKDETAEAA
jgi:large subunit ribosomal protein L10